MREYLIFASVSLALILLLFKACEEFPESSFTLASESRLPKWITLPSGLTRANASITMNYYINPWGRSATFVVQSADKQTISKLTGKMRCGQPFELKNPPQGFLTYYSSYEAITVNGITEIIEHRKMEPIFYVTDDATVRKEYNAAGCR